MAKDKKDTEKQEIPLTEWQQRNLEFLRKKQEEKLEKEKLNEKKIAEKRAQFQTDKDVSKEAKSKAKEQLVSDRDAEQEKPKEKQAKVRKPKKKRPRVIPRKDFWQAFLVITVSVLVLLFSLFMVSPFSRQKKVKVSGNKNTIEAQLIERSGIKQSDYLTSLIFDRSRFETTLKAKDKWIKEAHLIYHFPNNFTLKVKERSIIAYRKTDNGYIPILENGAQADTVNASELPESFLTINLDKVQDVQVLVKKLAKLDQALVKEIKTISSANSNSTKDLLLLEMTDGNTVRVPLSEIDSKLPYYPKIKKNLTGSSIVDMEVGLYSTNSDIEAALAEHKSSATSQSSSEEESSEPSADDNSSSSSAESGETTQQVTEATAAP